MQLSLAFPYPSGVPLHIKRPPVTQWLGSRLRCELSEVLGQYKTGRNEVSPPPSLHCPCDYRFHWLGSCHARFDAAVLPDGSLAPASTLLALWVSEVTFQSSVISASI